MYISIDHSGILNNKENCHVLIKSNSIKVKLKKIAMC
jgi:hypothetical protein